MDKAFITIVQNLVSEQGKEALFNAAKCKALLADYTRGEYKKESRLLLQAVEADVAKAIDSAQELQICKQQQARHLHEEYFLTEEIAAEVVDMLVSVLRPDNAGGKNRGSFCSECGAALNEGAKFCSSCGKPVATGQGVVQTSSQPEQKVSVITSSGGVGYGIDLITFVPKTSDDYVRRGNAQTDKNLAIADFTEAIRLDPLNLSAYYERAKAYDENNMLNKAVDDYIKIKELNPDRNSIFNWAGMPNRWKDDYDKSILFFTRLIELEPNQGEHFDNRGRVYLSKCKYDKAIADYSKAIELEPNNTYYLRNRSRAYKCNNKWFKGKADWEKALKIDPSFKNQRGANGRIVKY